MKMKTFIHLFSALVLLLGVFSSCELNEINTGELTDFSPGIASVTPADGAKVVKGNFDIKVKFADGESSPLANVELSLSDASENEIHSVSAELSGTRDSVTIAAADFDAASLEVGTYSLHILVTDTRGQITDVTTTFEISLLPFAANNDEMYIAGAFNGWSWDSMELVANNLWEVKNLQFDGGEWKFKNTKDWTDADWGDADCDGLMEITTGGGPNTNCAYSGLVNVRFNDQTLQYTIEPAVTLEFNLESLYLLGSFNDFQGTEYTFSQVDNHLWFLEEIVLSPGDKFRFSEGPFGGLSYGDIEPDGVADLQAPNIVMPEDLAEGVYSVTFNDETLEYSFEFIRNLFPDQLYLVGNSTIADWDPSNAVPFVSTGVGTFQIFSYITTAGEGFKFLQVQDWAGDWGEDPMNPGSLIQEGESNLSVDTDGFYRIDVNFINGTITITPSNWAIIGDGTPDGWTSDTDMTLVSETLGVYTWEINVTLTDGFMKFRENDGWDVNFGDNGTDGSLEPGGADIPVTAGTFVVQLVLDPVNGYTYSIN